MGSGAFMTGMSGTSGSYFMPLPMGFHVDWKPGIGLQVSCVHSSLLSLIVAAFSTSGGSGDFFHEQKKKTLLWEERV